MTRCIRALDDLMGKLVGGPWVIRQIEEWRDERPWPAPGMWAEWFEEACKDAALYDGRSLGYVLTTLRRWQEEGYKSDNRRKRGRSSPDAEQERLDRIADDFAPQPKAAR